MAPFTKRDCFGVLALFFYIVAGGLFLFTLIIGWAWFRAAYSSDLTLTGIWTWLSDSQNHQNLEPLVGLCGMLLSPLLVIAAFAFGLFRKHTAPSPAFTSETKPATRWEVIRGDLIKTVRKHWISDYQAQALFKRVRIKLGIQKTPEALDHPFHYERVGGGEKQALNDRSLLELFDHSGGQLLILGEPGSGKTFTLVQLAGLLLERAETLPEAAVPVVVPLASWALDQKPLEEWLGKELQHHYGLSAKDTAAQLAEGDRLILLLDGLDEVRESVRLDCLKAIQKFKDAYPVRIALCCRVQEYENLGGRLSRGEAIRILPLTEGQITAYLSAYSYQLTPLLKILPQEPELRELATTPLMLNVLATVYSSDEPPVQSIGTLEDWRDAIFSRYVRHMFLRKERRSTEGQIVAEETTFTSAQAIHWLQQIAKWMVKDNITTFYLERIQPRWVKSGWKYRLSLGLNLGLLVGLISNVKVGMIVGIITGMFGGALKAIKPVDAVRFIPKKTKSLNSFNLMTLSGLVGGAIIGLTIGLSTREFNLVTQMLILILIAGLIFCFDFDSYPQSIKPYQGIRNSLRTCIVALFVGTFSLTFLAVLIRSSMVLALTTAMVWLAVVFFGGVVVIQHHSVRLTLALEGTLPYPLRTRKLIAFLDAMRDRLLLTRVGGGWMFIHRLLLEYLAAEPFGRNPQDVEATLRKRM